MVISCAGADPMDSSTFRHTGILPEFDATWEQPRRVHQADNCIEHHVVRVSQLPVVLADSWLDDGYVKVATDGASRYPRDPPPLPRGVRCILRPRACLEFVRST